MGFETDLAGCNEVQQAGHAGILPGIIHHDGELAAVAAGCNDVACHEDFCEFDAREPHLLEALRTLCLLHYSARPAKRWDDPAFPAAFPWFNTQRYWQYRILKLREQVALMDEPPLPA